jgi:hypothetical protein
MQNDPITGQKSGHHFRQPIVAVADLHWSASDAAVLVGKNAPLVAFAEQSAHWHHNGIRSAPRGHVDDDGGAWWMIPSSATSRSLSE